jgi:excisionase family DNA binding protein
MAFPKYIGTKDAVRLTGLQKDEIYRLIKEQKLPAHKAPKSGWRIPYQALIDNGLIQEVVPSAQQSKSLSGMRLITENFFHEVIKRACTAESSIKIMTADFNLLRLEPTKKQGNKYGDGTPFFDFLIKKANEGVSVEIITAEKYEGFQDDVERAYCNTPSQCFSVWFCIRNHAKVVIIDDKFAYVGSANMTRAGLGQPHCSPGNFEVGVMTEDPEIIASLNERFTDIKKYKFCDDCHRQKDCIEYKYYFQGTS